MMRRTMFLLILILMIATVAEAQRPRPRSHGWQREGRWDMSLSTRYTTSKDYTGDGGSSLSLSDDLGWGFGFGYNFNQHFNLGAAFAWRSVPYSAVGLDADDPGGDPEHYSGRLTTSNFGLNGEYNVLTGKFTPYVNGTLSWMHIDSNIFAGYGTGCWWDYWYGYICGPVPMTYGANTTAWSLGAGVRYEVNENVFLRMGYEHGWIDLSGYEGSDMFRVDIGMML